MKNNAIVRFKAETRDYDASITKAKKKLSDFGNTGKTASQTLGQFDKVLGTSISSLMKLTGGAAAAGAAFKVLKDAFFESESNADAWGKTMVQAKAVYTSFLQTLNNGNFGGFLSGMDEVINRAAKLYDALDKLQTMATIRSPERAKLESQMTVAQEQIRKYGKDSAEGKAAQNTIRAIEPLLKASIVREGKDNYDAFKAAVDARLAEGGLNLNSSSYKLLMESFSSESAYNRLAAGAKGRNWVPIVDNYTGKTVAYQDTRNTNAKLMDLFTDEWREKYSPYLTAYYSSQGQAASIGKMDARYLNGGGSSGNGKQPKVTPWAEIAMPDMAGVDVSKFGSLGDLKGKLAEWQKVFEDAADPAGRAYARKHIEAIKSEIAAITAENNPFAQLYADAASVKNNSNIIGSMADSTASLRDNAVGAASAFSDAASAIAQFGENASEAQKAVGALTLASAIAQLVGQFASVPKGAEIWSWIAGTVAGTATLVATIAQLKQLSAFADGGQIPGQPTGGRDSVYIHAAPGEVILNAAQQRNVAAQLQQPSMGGMATASLEAETIVFAINNWGRRHGNPNIIPMN